MRDLQIGAEILKEALEREVIKEERLERAKKEEKAAAAAQVANVSTTGYVLCQLQINESLLSQIKQAFLDDRKSRTMVERRERELREARAAAASRPAQPTLTPPTPSFMPGTGTGRRLDGQEVTLADAPTAPVADDSTGDDDDDY